MKDLIHPMLLLSTSPLGGNRIFSSVDEQQKDERNEKICVLFHALVEYTKEKHKHRRKILFVNLYQRPSWIIKSLVQS